MRLVLFVLGAQRHRVFHQRVIPWLRSKLGRLACTAARDLRKVVRLLGWWVGLRLLRLVCHSGTLAFCLVNFLNLLKPAGAIDTANRHQFGQLFSLHRTILWRLVVISQFAGVARVLISPLLEVRGPGLGRFEQNLLTRFVMAELLVVISIVTLVDGQPRLGLLKLIQARKRRHLLLS